MNDDFIEPCQENDLLHVEGFWWIPGVDNAVVSKVPGTLLFRTEDQGELHLMKPLELSISFKVYDVIWGELLDGSAVTIFDAASYGIHGNIAVHPQMTCSAADIWWSKECHFKSKQDVAFKRFIFGISRLRAWDGRNGFKGNISCSKARILSPAYSAPKNKIIFEDDNVIAEVAYWYKQSGWSVIQSEAYVKDYPRIVIKAKSDGLKYYGDSASYEYYQRLLTSWLQLMIGEPSFTYDMRGENYRSVRLGNEKTGSLPVATRRLVRRRLNLIENQRDDFKCDFPRQVLKRSAVKYGKAYAEIFSKVEVQLMKLQRFMLRNADLDFELLFDLVVSLDGITENLFEREANAVLKDRLKTASEKDELKIKESMYKMVESNQLATDWLDKKLGVKRGPSFAMWIKGVLKTLTPISQALGDDARLAKVVDYIKEVRQAGAHSLSREYKHICENPELVVYMSHLLSYFIRVAVLSKCGVDHETLHKALHRPFCSFVFYDLEVSRRMSEWNRLK